MTEVTAKQIQRLYTFLDEHTPISFAWLHGFLTAFMNAPNAISPKIWFQYLEVDDETDEQQAHTAAQLAVDLCETIGEQLNENTYLPAFGPDDTNCFTLCFDEIQLWAKGYLFAVDKVCPFWRGMDEETYTDLLMPIALLSVEDEALRIMFNKFRYESYDILSTKSEYTARLADIVNHIYHSWSKTKKPKPSEIISFTKFQEARRKKHQLN